MAVGKIRELVDESALAQLDQLYQKLGITTQAMIDATAAAAKYTNEIGGVKTLTAFTTASEQAIAAMKGVKTANEDLVNTQKEAATQTEALVNKTRDALLAAEEKKQAALRKTENDYLVSVSKQGAAHEAQMQKEVDAAQRAAQKIIDIEQAKRDKLARMKSKTTFEPNNAGIPKESIELTKEEVAALEAKNQALANERAASIAAANADNQRGNTSKQNKQTIQAETDALSVQDRMLNAANGTLEQNIAQNIKYRLELSQVQNTLKLNSANTQGLTLREQELKTAIQQNDQIIKQQVKDQIAANGSQDQMIARLALLKKAYNGLSEEERNAKDIGQAWLKEINQLDAKTKAISQSQGEYNKSVGDYENAIKSAISQYVPFGAQLVQASDSLKNLTSVSNESGFSLRSLGTLFAGFSVAVFVTAIASAIYYMSQFRAGQTKLQEGLGILKQQFLDLPKILTGDKSLGDSAKQGIQIENLKIRAKYENEVTETIVKQMQAEADQLRAEDKNQLLTKEQRKQKAADAIAIEDQILDKLRTNADLQVKLALDVAERTGKLLPATRRNLEFGNGGAGDISEANYLAQQGKINQEGYEMYKAALDKRTEALQFATMRRIREENDVAKNEMKILKEQNHDELELLKARLEGEKITAKLILDDNKQSYEARLAALKIYTDRSKQLIGVQNQIANNAPQITGTKKQANNQTAKNENLGVDAFDLAERQKIQKEAIADFKAIVHQLNIDVTDDLKESLNQQQIAIEKDAAYKIDVLTDQFTQQKITLEKYNREIKLVQDRANEEKLQAEIDTYKQILGVQVAFEAAQAATGLPLSVASAGQIQGTKDKIATSETGLVRAKTQTKIDSAKGNEKDEKEKAKEFADAIGYVQQLQDDASKLVQQNYENEIALLEKRKAIIQETADFEVNRVQNSILSSKEKAREEAVIREQEKQQQLQVDAQITKIKERQAKYDRALSIANIIENTAVGISKATGSIFGLPLVPIIAALGAAQLATVLATPLPKFEKGTKSSPEGFAHVGEAGTELMIDPSGKMSLTPNTDTITYLKGGTQIISNKELQRMVGKPELILISGNQQADNRKLEKLMAENNELQKRQKRPIVNVHTDRWGDYSRQRNY